jgi:hypothetical protein
MRSVQPFEVGGGRVSYPASGVMLLTLPATPATRYADAQIDNYAGLRRREYPCTPPLRMRVRAQFSHPADQLVGTAGFGFWNQPFMPGTLIPRLPRYVWFFVGTPPHDMAFVQGVPGSGPKAATADFSRLPFLCLAPFAPVGFALMRVPRLYRALWPVAQWAIGAAEAPLRVDLSQPHDYRLDWRAGRSTFYVDGQVILEVAFGPRGRLGFVAWIDNQYAVITPQGRLGFGVRATPYDQWLRLEGLTITTPDGP